MRTPGTVPKTLGRQDTSADKALSAWPPRELPAQLDLDEIPAQAAGCERRSRHVDSLAHEHRERRAHGQVVVQRYEGTVKA